MPDLRPEVRRWHRPRSHGGEETITASRVTQPDAVVLDIGPPELDGYQVAKQMRMTEGARRTRLVAITGYAPGEFSARAEAAGFDTFLVKPVTLTTLRGALAASHEPVDAVA